MALKSGNCVLLTGVTGFLGKVVLEHLVRQREELHCHEIVVLIRGKNGKDGDDRFEDGVASSKCFSLLPEAWTDLVEVVDGDLETSELSLVPTTYERLCTEVTHIIHCAGCVKFDQSMAEAADTNVSTTLNVLAFAKKCTQLQHLITTSTAYVTPHRCGPIFETLSPLPQPAEDLHKSILKGEMSDARILEYTQHPNTYTLSKCITEHLLVADHGSVPLTIVRPSIISASWRFPFPGWIDSVSAFAGFLFAFANGLLRVVNADANTILDIIPVDEVAAQLVNAAFQKKDSSTGVSILYSTASLHNGMDISLVSSNTPEYFTHSRVASIRSPKLRYLGSRTPLFYFYDLVYQSIPLHLASIFFAVKRDQRMRRKVKRARHGLSSLKNDFSYFTHRSFDFRPSTVLPDDLNRENIFLPYWEVYASTYFRADRFSPLD